MNEVAAGGGFDASQEQVRAALLDSVPGVVVVTGAPGTGKSHTAMALVTAFIAGGGAPDAALLLAPTRVQAADLGATLSAQVRGTRTEPLVRTASSLAFSILSQRALAAGEPMPRLLTGAEQDAIIRDLLEGHASGAVPAPAWPHELAAALGTAGFRGQLRDLLMRAVERGVDAEQLRALAQHHRRPEWHAAAHVLEEYEQVTALASPGAFDPAYICVAAAQALDADPALTADLRSRLELLVIDDAQELTASAARLIEALYDHSMRVALLGDGDAVVQGFRGAVGQRFVELGRAIGTSDRPVARAVDELVLEHGHRLPAHLARVCGDVANGIGVSTGSQHRHPTATPTTGGGGGGGDHAAGSGQNEVEVAILPTHAHEAELVAHRLREAHLIEAVPWSQMAVIGRSGAQQEGIRRALSSAGVPVRTELRALPLAVDPAARPLLSAYSVVLQWCEGLRGHLSGEEVIDLLTSPIGRADPVALRRLRRAVRKIAPYDPEGEPGAPSAEAQEQGMQPEHPQHGRRQGASAAQGQIAARSTAPLMDVDEVMGRWVLDPHWLVAGVETDRDLEPLSRLAAVLRAGRKTVLQSQESQGVGLSAHALLWELWVATGLPRLWERAALGQGAAAVRADRHLDAVMRLFGAAQDFATRLGRQDLGGFVAHVSALEVAPDSLIARAWRPEEVSVLTPQAAAGGGWSMVAVVGVQEGVWPNLRARGSLLGAEALVEALRGRPIDGAVGMRSAQSQVWADELRQFYVALSRGSQHLIVTAVASTQDQPSAFIDLLDADGQGRTSPAIPPRLTLRGAVGALRRDLVRAHRDGETHTRDRCADQLAGLAEAGVAWADPSSWVDARALSTHDARVAEGLVRVSPSKVQSFNECALRWLLTSHGGDRESLLSSAVGTLVHDVVATDPEASREVLIATLDERWAELRQDQSWVSARAQRRARDMLSRFVAYRAAAREGGRELVGVELPASVEVGRALLTGRVDRLEKAPDGSFIVVDLKTGSAKPAVADIAAHPQLAAYQVALVEGGLVEATGNDHRSAGAALAHLGTAGGKSSVVQRQAPLDQADDPDWAHTLIERSALGMAGAAFPATLGAWCRSCVVKTCCPMQPEGDRQ